MALGFFISDHPLNQYKDYFNQYDVINFNEYDNNENLKEGVLYYHIKFKKKIKRAIIWNNQIYRFRWCFWIIYIFDLFEQKREILKKVALFLWILLKIYPQIKQQLELT